MLQIITGKFFRDVELYSTLHRGVYYSNYHVFERGPISTNVGVLLPSTAMSGMSVFTYEIMEKLEAVNLDGSRSGIAATSGNMLANDFAAVISFALNITCSIDPDLTRRLIDGEHPSLGMNQLPSRYLRRMFDKKINAAPNDIERLQSFVDRLVGLDRPVYEAVIRSIQQYITAAHRLSDNPDLSYTLFVAALESLAANHEPHTDIWENYNDKKRRCIETALEGASDETANKVRRAIIENEHLGLKRRFQAFVLDHLEPSFFRTEAIGIASPIVRSDIETLVKRAYDIRSSYIHTLAPIPRILDIHDDRFESHKDDKGKPVLSFNGLARLARHVILSFMKRQKQTSTSKFDYRVALPNIINMPLASHYWIANAQSFNVDTSREYLGAFMQQVAAHMLKVRETVFSDIRPVLKKIEKELPKHKSVDQRIPMLLIYWLWESFLATEYHMPRFCEIISKYESDFLEPTVENLFQHVFRNEKSPWSLDKIKSLIDKYVQNKQHKNGLQAGALLEAATYLWYSEKLRQAGDEVNARASLALAVENYPNHAGLREFESIANETTLPEIDWTVILLPQFDKQ